MNISHIRTAFAFAMITTIWAIPQTATAQAQSATASTISSSSNTASNSGGTTIQVTSVVPSSDLSDPATYQHIAKGVAAQTLPLAAKNLTADGLGWNVWSQETSGRMYKTYQSYVKGDEPTPPIFLDSGDTTGDYSDWNGIDGGVEFSPGASVSSRAYIFANIKFWRGSYYVYTPDSAGSYNLSIPPTRMILTHSQETKYWNQLAYGRNFFDNPKAWDFLIGFSPANFKIGTSSSAAVPANTTSYFAGVTYLLNPYAGLSAGFSTGDGHQFLPTFGLNLDVSIISKIFGG